MQTLMLIISHANMIAVGLSNDMSIIFFPAQSIYFMFAAVVVVACAKRSVG